MNAVIALKKAKMYTDESKKQLDNNYVKRIELDGLVEQKIDENFDSISSDEIKKLFN